MKYKKYSFKQYTVKFVLYMWFMDFTEVHLPKVRKLFINYFHWFYKKITFRRITSRIDKDLTKYKIDFSKLKSKNGGNCNMFFCDC